MAEIKDGGPQFPCAFKVHWATGPVDCCVRHARALIALGRLLGSHVAATAPTEGAECINCKNEADAMIRAREANHG